MRLGAALIAAILECPSFNFFLRWLRTTFNIGSDKISQ